MRYRIFWGVLVGIVLFCGTCYPTNGVMTLFIFFSRSPSHRNGIALGIAWYRIWYRTFLLINGVRTPKIGSGIAVSQVSHFFTRILGKKIHTERTTKISLIGDLK